MSGWNTNIFVTHECRLCSEYAVLDDIIDAVNERCSGAGIALLSTDHRLYSVQTVKSLIQAKVNTLIPLYVNHTLPLATPGNYDGETTIPMFTEETMLTAIGAASRLPATRLYVDEEWAMQQYKIVNILRCNTGSIIRYNHEAKRALGDDDDDNTAWLIASNNWDSATWDFTPYWDEYAMSNGIKRHPTSFQYKDYLSILYGERSEIHYNNNTVFDVDFDLYFMGGKKSYFVSPSLVPPVFWDGGQGILEDLYNKYATGTQLTGVTSKISDAELDKPVAPPSPESQVSCALKSPILIQKFTGENGFTYKDW